MSIRTHDYQLVHLRMEGSGTGHWPTNAVFVSVTVIQTEEEEGKG